MPRQKRPPSKCAPTTPQAGDWVANPGPQTAFLSNTAFEILYGGQAGGGKTASLTADALRYVGCGYGSAYQGTLFRKTFEDLKKTVLLETHDLYPRIGGRYNAQDHCWVFPGGERIWLGYLDHDNDILRWQGAQLQYCGFDELTQFTEAQYLYLFSRIRSTAGIPGRVRAATNPGGPGHEWVFKRWGPWLDPGATVRAAPGQTLHYAVDEDGEHLTDARDPTALGRCFIPSTLSDNPHLARDPQYRLRLDRLDPVTRAQLRDGNWLIRPARGMYFKRSWFEIVDAAPADASRVRYWDRASTGETEAAKRKRSDPDYTAGVKISRTRDGVYYVEHVCRFRGKPLEVEQTIRRMATQDGRRCLVGIEQDPGQAGQADADNLVRVLDGYNARRYPARQDKITRAGPSSSQAEAGNFRMVRGDWNEAFLAELEAFPEGSHDDQVDAFSGAHMALAKPTAPHVDPELSTVESRYYSTDDGY